MGLIKNYTLLKNQFTQNELNIFLSSIQSTISSTQSTISSTQNTQVDYTKMNNFIEKIYMRKLQEQFGWSPIYVKFRFSNHENAKDAATLHGDLYNFTNEKFIPIYTGLLYLDESTLEIIPETATKSNKSANELYKNRKVINTQPGDMLIFNSFMHHRGLFYNSKDKDRRLLQIFEIYPNEEIFNKYHSKFMTVLTPSNKTLNNLSYFTSYNKTIADLINYINYWLVVNNMQYKIILNDIPDKRKKGKIIGYVPGDVDIIKKNTLQPTNVNITVVKHIQLLAPTKTKKCLLFVFLIFVIIFIIYKQISKK